jgi:hypothetical protein
MSDICHDVLLNNIGDAAIAIAALAAICLAALAILAIAAKVVPTLLFGPPGDDGRILYEVQVWCEDRLTDPLLRAELLGVLDGPDGAP